MVLGRFFYGMRIAGGFVCGLVGMPMRKFLFWATIGCMAWAVVVGSVGYLLGEGVQLLLGDVRNYQWYFFLGMIGIGLLGWVFFLWSGRRRKRHISPS